MSVVEVSADIDAPPEAVWKVVADPRNLPRWNRHIISVEDVPTDGLQLGSHYTAHLAVMGVRGKSRATVVDLRPPEYAKIQLTGIVEATVETWLEPRNRSKSRLRHRIVYRFRGGPLGEVAARAVNAMGAMRLLRKGIQAQKEQAENR
ncbi:MAG TPA: SRPBCC family protein [Actinomycetota bacterium]